MPDNFEVIWLSFRSVCRPVAAFQVHLSLLRAIYDHRTRAPTKSLKIPAILFDELDKLLKLTFCHLLTVSTW